MTTLIGNDILELIEIEKGGIVRHHEPPEIGNWFFDKEYQCIFEVVALDEVERNIEIQYFTGEIEELDLDTWYELELNRIPAPEDWSGPFEIPREDLGYSDETFHPEDWSGPLNDFEPDGYLH